jgi:phospholipid/cholesterol/gamma-HCH transport system ATP-binding protein
MAMLQEAPEIRLDNVTAGYGGKAFLHSIDAVLPAGAISAILGGSGSGKSTLLRHILGLMAPLGGTITMNGLDLTHARPRELRELRRQTGVLFQEGALLGSLTVGENVALPLREHTDLDLPTISRIVLHKLELVGLETFASHLPEQLSGGMRKRVALARALALDPLVLFCDEPTAGLDPITAAELDRLILDLKKTFGMTIVVVTHDLESVYAVADHVLVLLEGALIYQGDVAGLKSSDNDYIGRFLDREPGQRCESWRLTHGTHLTTVRDAAAQPGRPGQAKG